MGRKSRSWLKVISTSPGPPPNSAPIQPFPLTNDSSQCPARVAVTNPRPSTDGQATQPCHELAPQPDVEQHEG